MGFRTWRAATVVVLSLALSGCGGGDDHSTAQRRRRCAQPDVGTCWAVPPKEANDHNHWFDDSPTVPCNKPHNAETVTLLVLTKPTVAEAKKMPDDVCWNAVRIYDGVDPDHWVPWMVGTSLPSREQIAEALLDALRRDFPDGLELQQAFEARPAPLTALPSTHPRAFGRA